MGILDTLRDRLGLDAGQGRGRDPYYDDGYEDDPYADGEGYDDYADEGRYDERGAYGDAAGRGPRERYADEGEERHGSGMLGNTPRPNAESVSVYTRSGRLVDSNAGFEDVATPVTYSHQPRRDAPATSWQAPQVQGAYHPSPQLAAQLSGEDAEAPAAGALSYGHVTPGDVGLTAVPRSSGKLPAYVLKPREYEDVQVMVSRVRTNQPVVLDFQGTRIELAKRILDYSFGFAAGVEGTVRELGDRCFAVLPRAVELTASELDKLEHEGVIRR